MRINVSWFLAYKTINSLFAGLSLGAIIGIYAALEPETFSIGGAALAIGTFFVALCYSFLMKIKAFFVITIAVELAVLCAIIFCLIDPNSYAIVAIIYICYQVSFLFGGYLLRAETLFLRRVTLLSRLDALKQIGYIAGLIASYFFYAALNETKTDKIWLLHWLLLAVEIATIAFALLAFNAPKRKRAAV
jgi:hypothetical protein